MIVGADDRLSDGLVEGELVGVDVVVVNVVVGADVGLSDGFDVV